MPDKYKTFVEYKVFRIFFLQFTKCCFLRTLQGKFYEQNPDFIAPESRKNEVRMNFMHSALEGCHSLNTDVTFFPCCIALYA